jgi:hypothetical protein
VKNIVMASAAMLAALALAGCEQSAEDKAKAAAAKAAEDAKRFAAAEKVIRGKLAQGADVKFRDMKSYDNDGVNIVCGVGDAAFPGKPVHSQRFIVVGGDEAYMDMTMEAGEMDRALKEFCTDKAPSSSSERPDLRDDAQIGTDSADKPEPTQAEVDSATDAASDAAMDAADFASE